MKRRIRCADEDDGFMIPDEIDEHPGYTDEDRYEEQNNIDKEKQRKLDEYLEKLSKEQELRYEQEDTKRKKKFRYTCVAVSENSTRRIRIDWYGVYTSKEQATAKFNYRFRTNYPGMTATDVSIQVVG